MAKTAKKQAEAFVLELPTQDDLPYEDGEPLESNKHRQQMTLLIAPLETLWRDREDVFVGGNMFIYFSPQMRRDEDFRGPDVFVVTDTTAGQRKSWVVWQEERVPDVVIELTSASTREVDETTKREIYARRLRVPHYAIFDPESGDFWGGQLNMLHHDYIDDPLTQGRMLCPRVGLALGVWHGRYANDEGPWLRWYTLEGELIPTDHERAQRESERAQRESERAQREASLRRGADARVAEEAAKRRALEAEIAALQSKLRVLEESDEG